MDFEGHGGRLPAAEHGPSFASDLQTSKGSLNDEEQRWRHERGRQQRWPRVRTLKKPNMITDYVMFRLMWSNWPFYLIQARLWGNSSGKGFKAT